MGKSLQVDADLASLQGFPGHLGCFEVAEYTVDKWATIHMKHVHYSVPDTFVGEKVRKSTAKKSSSFTERKRSPRTSGVTVAGIGVSAWNII